MDRYTYYVIRSTSQYSGVALRCTAKVEQVTINGNVLGLHNIQQKNNLNHTEAESSLKVIFRSSSMVEQEAVNFEVAGSSPASGARLSS